MVALKQTKNCTNRVFNICLLEKLPRRMSFRTRMENQISI